MDKYALSEEENVVYTEIASLMRKLGKAASQHKVLKKLAHDMDREVIRPGQVRAAAAAARGAAAAQSGSKRNSDNPSATKKPKQGAKADPIYDEWAKGPGAELVHNQKALKDSLKLIKDEKSEEFLQKKEEVKQASAKCREALHIFRINKVDAKKDHQEEKALLAPKDVKSDQ